MEALRRELAEELEMPAVAATEEFVRFDFDLSRLGQKQCYRTYYEIKTTEAEVGRFVLHEGAEMRLFAVNELFELSNVAPYDSVRDLASPCTGPVRHARHMKFGRSNDNAGSLSRFTRRRGRAP